MPLLPTEQAAADLLSEVNGGRYNAVTNPRGMANGGHKQNAGPAWNATATIGRAVSRLAGQADASAAEALRSASDAASARDKAEKWADEAVDLEVEAGQYSARHYATKAAFLAEMASEAASLSQDWAAGTEPGGPGTRSARQEADRAVAAAGSVNLPPVEALTYLRGDSSGTTRENRSPEQVLSDIGAAGAADVAVAVAAAEDRAFFFAATM